MIQEVVLDLQVYLLPKVLILLFGLMMVILVKLKLALSLSRAKQMMNVETVLFVKEVFVLKVGKLLQRIVIQSVLMI